MPNNPTKSNKGEEIFNDWRIIDGVIFVFGGFVALFNFNIGIVIIILWLSLRAELK